MNIPEQAIETAAKALFGKAGYAVNWDDGWGEDFEGIQDIYRGRARAALEAAAPFIAAETLNQAAQAIIPDGDPEDCTTAYDSYDVAEWLYASAANQLEQS